MTLFYFFSFPFLIVLRAPWAIFIDDIFYCFHGHAKIDGAWVLNRRWREKRERDQNVDQMPSHRRDKNGSVDCYDFRGGECRPQEFDGLIIGQTRILLAADKEVHIRVFLPVKDSREVASRTSRGVSKLVLGKSFL